LAPSTLVSPASGVATVDSTPALTAKATDADGDQVSLDIEIWASNGSAWLQAAAQPYVPSGTAVTWSVPSAVPLCCRHEQRPAGGAGRQRQ
jgi:hypothetical protein